MPGSSSWMPSAPQGVKGFDDDDDVILGEYDVHQIEHRNLAWSYHI
jgi:hypothetical protein